MITYKVYMGGNIYAKLTSYSNCLSIFVKIIILLKKVLPDG